MHTAYNTIEERVDLVFADLSAPLRDKPLAFWRKVVNEAGAKILAKQEGFGIDSYVLSESSLFVFDDRMVMITCGATTLLDGAIGFARRMADEKLARFVYQRRGLPEASSKEFRERLSHIRAELGPRLGAAVVDGDTVLFHPPPQRPRLGEGRICAQLMMRKLNPRVEAIFRGPADRSRERAIAGLGLQELVKGFQVLDHHFTPFGYSLNAIGESEYYTIHISPQGPQSFASFEFDGHVRNEVGQCLRRLLSVFAPKDHRLEILHPGRSLNLAGFSSGARWETHALGFNDSRSLLVTEVSASASA